MASLKAIEPAILNAISEESTSWYLTVEQLDPEVDHRETGKVAFLAGLLDAFFHRRAEALGDGTAEDLVDLNSKSSPAARGSIWMVQSANCPRPPVCFL